MKALKSAVATLALVASTSAGHQAEAAVLTVTPPGLPGTVETWGFQGVDPLPDRITFYSSRTGNNEIYAMNFGGSSQVNLTQQYSEDRSPDWSPDAGRIAFYSNRDFNFDVYIMDADGRKQTNLTRHLNADLLPDWSPLCAKVLICADRNPDPYHVSPRPVPQGN